MLDDGEPIKTSQKLRPQLFLALINTILYATDSQSVGPGQAASHLYHRKLVRNTNIQTHLSTTESVALGVEPSNLCLKNLSKGSLYTLKLWSHYSKQTCYLEMQSW